MLSFFDSHIHRYPEEIFDNPVLWAKQRKEYYWAKLITPRKKGYTLQGWADRSRLLKDMDAAGIEKVVMQAWYWQNQETCELHNQWHLQWIKEDPDRLLAFASVQPLGGDAAFDSLRRAVDGGLCGIGEIHPGVQGFTKDNPIWLKILDWAQKNDLPVNLHATEPVGRSYPGKIETPLASYVWIASTFPKLKLILAHWGGGLPFYELNAQCKKILKNVYYDTAASPLLYDKRVFRAGVNLVGAEKILFGSDYPLKLYPQEQKEPDFLRFVQDILDSGLTKAQCQKIMCENAKQLLMQ
jgi:uncharacterized protein